MIDLRDHLERLEEEGELKIISRETNWNLQAAAICAMANRVGGQAIHFKKIRGYSERYTLAGSLLTGPGTFYPHKRSPWGRFALSLDLEPKIGYEDLIATLIERQKNPIMPVEVSQAPCKEEIHLGDEADLFEFPLPLLHQDDGGRYSTCHTIMAKDLESDWQNWGTYRFMAVSSRRLVVGFEPKSHLALIYQRYKKRGEPMPFCIAIGGAPAILIASAMNLQPGLGEAEYAGGLNLDPINLIKAETNSLLVPGDAEIVIEGEVLSEEREEGPFGAIFGYTRPRPLPLFQVKAITHKREPILPFIVDGTKVSDTQVIISLLESARLTRMAMEEAQHPIRWINLPVDYNLGLCLVSGRNYYHGYVFRVARYLFSISKFFDKIVFVDDHIEPIDLPRILNDMAQKCHPTLDHHYIKNTPKTLLTPYIAEGESGTNLYMDATWPPTWTKEDIPIEITFENIYPKEIQERVIQRWKEFGFEMEAIVYPQREER